MRLKIYQDHTWGQFLVWINDSRSPHVIKCVGHGQFDLAGMMKYCSEQGFTMQEITDNMYQVNNDNDEPSEKGWEYISDHPLEWRTRNI